MQTEELSQRLFKAAKCLQTNNILELTLMDLALILRETGNLIKEHERVLTENAMLLERVKNLEAERDRHC